MSSGNGSSTLGAGGRGDVEVGGDCEASSGFTTGGEAGRGGRELS